MKITMKWQMDNYRMVIDKDAPQVEDRAIAWIEVTVGKRSAGSKEETIKILHDASRGEYELRDEVSEILKTWRAEVEKFADPKQAQEYLQAKIQNPILL